MSQCVHAHTVGPVRSHSVARFAGSYFSVPQIGEYHSSEVNHMKDAIASIPAYIERCSHCAPPACVGPLREQYPRAPLRLNCVCVLASQFWLSFQRCGITTCPK